MAPKKVAMVIASRDFRDEEYFETKEVLEKGGVEIITASDKTGTAIGKFGGEAKVDCLINDLMVEELDGILFVGGPGALEHLDNNLSYILIQKALKEDKLLGAICISPVILARAGVLKGKKATVWSSILDKTGVKALKENGAEYVPEDVVVDGKIVTASGPGAAKEFGEKVLELLTK
jgi:protease I